VTERPDRPPRGESRETVELRALRTTHPELASAIDLQLELVAIQRRIQARVPLPRLQGDPQRITALVRAGRPTVRFEDIPLDWTDFRLAVRQNADALHRHEAIEAADHREILALGRDAERLEPLVRSWYDACGVAAAAAPTSSQAPDLAPGLEHVLVLSIRPFLARCAEVLAPPTGGPVSTHGRCPLCGWEPDFATIAPSGERRLICGRCLAQWAFDPIACPYCANDDRGRITSFATRDGRYRVYACDHCRRYLKAYDGRNAPRPVLIAVDAIATLPLDAAAMQRGYSG
jgi:hypothetical protein